MDRRFIAKKEFNLNRFIIYKKKNMNELIAKIKELNEAFMSDAALQIEKGNKAEFRKASLEASKQSFIRLLKIFISHPSGWLSYFLPGFAFISGDN